jgi:DHA2 family multidrug resistance protein
MMLDFGINVNQASWISTAYIIASAIFVPIFGKLGDMIGRKPLYLFGIIGFTLTSMLAGLSFNLSSMVFFRVLQAITVSIDYPIALSIIAYTFEERGQRALAMGLWSGVFAGASVFGPLLGGPLIDAFSWRAVFYVNVPLGAIATWMAITFINEKGHVARNVKNFDIFGSLLLGIALGTTVYVLNQGQTWGWTSSNSIITYVIIVISFIAFLIVERYQKEPIVDLKFFKIPTFSAALITSFISFMGLIGGIFLIPLFVQNFLGYSVTKSGYLFIPMAFSILLGAPTGARLSTKIQARFVTAGGMLLSALMVFFMLSGIDIKWGFWDIAWRLTLFAFGLGMGLSPLTVAATSTVPIEEVGVASSILALVRNVSGAFGVAIFATILTDSTTNQLLNLQKFTTIHTNNPAIVGEVMALISVKANVLAYSTVFHVSGILIGIGAVTALFMKEKHHPAGGRREASHPIDM